MIEEEGVREHLSRLKDRVTREVYRFYNLEDYVYMTGATVEEVEHILDNYELVIEMRKK